MAVEQNYSSPSNMQLRGSVVLDATCMSPNDQFVCVCVLTRDVDESLFLESLGFVDWLCQFCSA